METENGEQGKISRRSFLVLVGGSISTISLGSMPLVGYSYGAAIEFPESKCEGKGKMDKKVLVAYASKYGSTGGVADAIGKEFLHSYKNKQGHHSPFLKTHAGKDLE